MHIYNHLQNELFLLRTYLDSVISTEGHLLRHFDLDRVTSGVLDDKAVSEGDAVGLGST